MIINSPRAAVDQGCDAGHTHFTITVHATREPARSMIDRLPVVWSGLTSSIA
ncbi:MAG: hypothetical protein J6N71_04215 [Muribaculaceae bacterium]|nr:hypothetical protein [Muribaculaceae bacterium]